MPTPTRKEKQDYIAKIPWVKRLKEPVKCEGWVGGASLTRGKYTCKLKAKWHFKALQKSYGDTGNYCWTHLLSRGIFSDMDEEARTKKWRDKHPAPWEGA